MKIQLKTLATLALVSATVCRAGADDSVRYHEYLFDHT